MRSQIVSGLTLALLLVGCPPPETTDAGPGGPVPDADIDARADAPAAWPMPAPLSLDASASTHADGRALQYAWAVVATPVGDCDGELVDGNASLATFTPSCIGEHTFEVTVSTFDGGGATERVTVDFVSVGIAFGDIEPAAYNESAQVFIAPVLDGVAEDVVTWVLEATPVAPATNVPVVTGDGSPFLVPMLDPLGTYDLALHGVVDDVVVTGTVTATVTALNGAPEISNLRVTDGPLTFGGSVTVTADVSDPEGDPFSCSLTLTGGNATDVTITETTDCVYTFDAPSRVEQWEVSLTASDGTATSPPATLTIQPDNDAPTVTLLDTGEPRESGYSCDSDQNRCFSDDVFIELDIADDIDADDDLVVTAEIIGGDANTTAALTDGTPTVGDRRFGLSIVRPLDTPVGGVWEVAIRVTEVSFVDTAGTSTAPITVTVTSAPPLVDAPNTSENHTWDAVNGYQASGTISVTLDDPEGFPVSFTAALVSCPTAAAGAAGCGDAELDVVVDVTGDDISVAATAPNDLSLLVGDFTVRITATDIDGEVTEHDAVFAALNRLPVLSTPQTLTESVGLANDVWSASVLLATDPDGDPLGPGPGGITVRCPTTLRVIDPVSAAECDFNTLSLNGATLQMESTRAFDLPDMLGGYSINGSLTDGVDELALTNVQAILNKSPPSALSRTSGTASCNHTTSSNTVSNESGCEFSVTVDGTNTGPVQLELPATVDGFSTVLVDAPVQALPNSVDFRLTGTLQEYLSQGDVSHTVNVLVVDAFGQFNTYGSDFTLENRAPIWGNGSAILPRTFLDADRGLLETSSGFGYTTPSRFQGEIGTEARIAGQRTCVSTCQPPSMEFTIHLDVTDPDGDPIRVFSDVSCNIGGPPTLADGTWLAAAFYDLPSDGNATRYLWAEADDCGLTTNRWYFAIPHTPGGWRFLCSLPTLSAGATDDVAGIVNIPDVLERRWWTDSTSYPAVCD